MQPALVIDAGRYRLVRRIAEGGMGEVYEGEHVALGRRVAIKMMRPELGHSAEAVGRFRREARIASNLRHDNVCEVLDVVQSDDGREVLVMPLLRGAPLSTLIARTGCLEIRRALDIAAQLLSALEAAHRAGIVHRDLKPDNVFITEVGDRSDFVKVLDFGVSKIVDGHTSRAGLTRTGMVLGSPQYMPPEQARGRREQDHRVDLYAVGAILYEMTSGRPAFESGTYQQVLVRVMTASPPPLRALRPDVPIATEAIVTRAMARDPAARFPSATSMRAEILAALEALPAEAAPTSIDPREPGEASSRGDSLVLTSAITRRWVLPTPSGIAPDGADAEPISRLRAVAIGATAGLVSLAVVVLLSSASDRAVGPASARPSRLVAASTVVTVSPPRLVAARPLAFLPFGEPPPAAAEPSPLARDRRAGPPRRPFSRGRRRTRP